jgi:hypothetical protein
MLTVLGLSPGASMLKSRHLSDERLVDIFWNGGA